MPSTQKIIRLIKREFPDIDVSFSKGGHIRLQLPNGAKVSVSSSPSDEFFFMRHVRADIKRAMQKSA